MILVYQQYLIDNINQSISYNLGKIYERQNLIKPQLFSNNEIVLVYNSKLYDTYGCSYTNSLYQIYHLEKFDVYVAILLFSDDEGYRFYDIYDNVDSETHYMIKREMENDHNLYYSDFIEHFSIQHNIKSSITSESTCTFNKSYDFLRKMIDNHIKNEERAFLR